MTNFIAMYIFAATATLLILRRIIVKEPFIKWLITKD